MGIWLHAKRIHATISKAYRGAFEDHGESLEDARAQQPLDARVQGPSGLVLGGLRKRGVEDPG